jgi:hypothetical protein
MAVEIRLPPAPPRYDQRDQTEFRRIIQLLLARMADPTASDTGGGGGGGGGGITSVAVGEGLGVTGSTTITITLARAREEVAFTTASLADGATAESTVSIGCRAALLVGIEADRACRVRFYDTSAARAADSARGEATDPAAGIGVLAEYIFTGADTYGAEPPIILKNGDGSGTTVYYAVENQSGATSTVEVTLTILELED